MTTEDKKSFELVKNFYKDERGKPFEMCQGQIDIFRTIYERQIPRFQTETYTRYGKSEIVSMAVLTRASTFPEKWAIIAGTKAKAGIIMGYLIKHIFENEYTKSKFRVDKNESLERIRRERSKERITFRLMKEKDQVGEVYILSGDSRRKGEDAGDSLMGFGCIFKGNYISTDIGYLSVDELFNTKITDKVYSFNHKENKIELKKILSYQKNPVNKRRMVIIDLGDRKIRCTDDHPVYIENKGYIKAKDIKIKDTMWVMD